MGGTGDKHVLGFRSVMTTPQRSRMLELVEVEITFGCARSSVCGYDGLFDGKLDDERLHNA